MKLSKEMKAGVASAAALFAGSSVASAADAEVMSGHDWEGFYLGVSGGVLFGELAWDDSSGDYTLDNNFVPGGFAGFNWDNDGLIVGAEIAVHFPDKGVKGDDTSYPGDYGFTLLADAKFRVGTSFGADNQILAYAFAGISGGDMSAASNDESYTAFGPNYGIGVDYAVADQFSIGIELIGRTMDGYSDNHKMHTNGQVSLRASFHF